MAQEPDSLALESPVPESPPAPIQEVSSDATPEILPQSTAEDQPKKPKRLTLQERLALAAKKKKKAASEAQSVPDSPKPVEETPAVEEPTPEHDETAELKKQLEKLQLHSQQLLDENKLLKAAAVQKTPSLDLSKKLAEKDTLIQQLMDEGQALSAKEIKLHEKVRAMAATNAKLENSLKEYATKNEDALLKLEEVESIMKTHKLKSVDQLLELLEVNSQKLNEAKLALEDEKSKNWEGKYRELQKQYELELEEKRHAQKELNDLNIKLQMEGNQLHLDLKLREDTIALLKQEISSLKDESSTEITRLESKIEGLRLENESFLKMLMLNNEADASTATEAESKHIAYSEFAKLSEAHKNLQQQYVLSQENWKLIESQLLSKSEALLELLNSLKKSKVKAQTEMRRLNGQISQLKEELEQVQQKVKDLENANNDLKFQLSVKEDDYKELETKKEDLTSIFNSDRHNWELQEEKLKSTIEKLEEQVQELRESSLVGGPNVDSFAHLQSRKLRDSGLHINIEPMRGSSGNLVPLYNQTLDSEVGATPAGFGNSFEAPNLSHNNLLALSFTDDLDSFEATETGPIPEDALVYWRNSADRSGIPASQGGKNIQLLSKMSANIRRLELEITALKEENEKLSEDKDEAQQEIVAKQDLNIKLENLEHEISRLQKEIDQKLQRETTLLEVIGEKSERVEELNADVADLKDLCRQQVQQMIEMAENK